MIPATAGRVPAHTAAEINEEIREGMNQRVVQLAEADPAVIDGRLHEIDAEWDIERTLETNAAVLAFAGTVLAATVSKKWLLLPGLVTAFLLQHAIQGWCPPVPVLRRLGFRTSREQEEERFALKILRGDFDHLFWDGRGMREPFDVLDAVRQ